MTKTPLPRIDMFTYTLFRSVDILGKVLADPTEHAMVRHEAAEALGAIEDNRVTEWLQRFATDEDLIVAHSCVVALDERGH
jgi:deoxyhypusine monooxygenase